MDIAGYSHSLAEAANDASQWVERNSELVRNEKESLLKELRRARRAFTACEKAAGRPMCAGVFGPSQAGKSYLISALARGKGDELIAQFGDKNYDFVSEINPPGGKEATGLVTRFTLHKPKDVPSDYPVQTRLLSETDLVKIIANTYFADCEHREEPQSVIADTLANLKKRQKDKGTGISLDALEDLREYLVKDFRGKARVQELERSYWEEAIELGQRLDLEGRIQLYALIWDEVPEFTDYLRVLLNALDKLNFADTLYCSIDALIPREKSIIDVDTLRNKNGEGEGDVSVCTPAGIKIDLSREVVTALIAELTIVMKDKPADYFEHTDLLDFPGYRSRYKIEDIHAELKKNPDSLKELFLRGKVAYLFQRYCADRELTSMLLCIGHGNQEVQDLPLVIGDWIDTTHGATPEARANKLVSLFFILTMIDMEFDDKKGAPSVADRWDIRLKSSLLDFFGKQRDWPEHWTPDKAFDNIFLLRNPNFKFKAVLEYEGDTEIGIRESQKNFVEQIHNAFMKSDLVAAHFKDPVKAWNEVMKLNDGGVSFIRESLSPLCDPGIKERQLLENINLFKDNINRRLKPFYHSDDREQLRKQKALMATTIYRNLGAMEKNKHRQGQLLRNFTIDDNELYNLYPEALRRFRDREVEPAAPRQETVPEEGFDLESFDLDSIDPLAQDQQPEADQPAQIAQDDEASFYASYIESKWVEKLHQIADDPILQKYYNLSGAEFSALASELATGAARMGFKEKLIEEFHKAAAYANTTKESIARKQAAIAMRMLNTYIDWLGFQPYKQSDSERTLRIFGSKDRVVFSPHEEIKDVPVLPDLSENFSSKWFSDWNYALVGLIMDNVDFDGRTTINTAENSALGKIIKTLDTKITE